MNVADRWNDLITAAKLCAIDPAGLGGVVLRASAGPARDLWLDVLRQCLASDTSLRRVPTGVSDDRLLGGIDLPSTLKAGRPVMQKGLLAESNGGVLVIAMAERLEGSVGARIAQAMDRGEVTVEREGMARRLPARFGIVALDEGVSPEEHPPAALTERCAFPIALDGLRVRELALPNDLATECAVARARFSYVKTASEEIVIALVKAAAALGIGSLVAPLLALRTARAAAALSGRMSILTEDAELAARLVLGPRAVCLPEEQQAQEQAPEQPPQVSSTEDQIEGRPPENPDLTEILLAAAQAALPENLLEMLKFGATMRGPKPQSGAGSKQVSLKRGRPAGVRMAAPRPGARLALIETLRAAAPWQTIRQNHRQGAERRIEIRREDFRIRKFAERREASIVFCVDASGSAAFHRLAEAKGAVELLLAEAYIARTRVALVAFRGVAADLLLPPTRSLTRARALLTTLSGGGGTPLAAGLDMTLRTALAERARGCDPLIVLLTDGRANIARDGQPDRARAAQESIVAAKQFCAQRLAAICIDTSPRPRDEMKTLAGAMAARYIALPYVEAGAVRDAVRRSISPPGLAAA